MSKQKPCHFAIYNDDVHLGQNLLLTPLIATICEIFPDSVIHLIVPRDIHYLWKSGEYKVIIVNNLCQFQTKNYDIVFGVTKKESFLAKPQSIRTNFLIAEDLLMNFSAWVSNIQSNHYLDFIQLDLITHDRYLANRYLNYISPWRNLIQDRDLSSKKIFYPIKQEAEDAVILWLVSKRIWTQKRVYLNLGGVSNTTWRCIENYIELTRRLFAWGKDLSILLNNGPSENALVQEYISQLPSYRKNLYIVPKHELELQYTAAMIKNCHLTITKDSGIYHLSNAVGAHTLVFTHYCKDMDLWLKESKNVMVIATNDKKKDPTIEEVFKKAVKFLST
jgi:ADP-heptose:LPS heptosyltransferase